jgi:hypothetical protein
MKKILLAIIVSTVLSANWLFSQDRIFKPFKVDVGFSYDIPMDDNTSSGAGMYIEPRYGVNDNIVVGLRIGGSFMGAGNVKMNFTSINVSSTTIMPVLFTGEYCFSTNNPRPFVGVGFGMYKKTIHSVDLSAINGIFIGPTTETNIGFALKTGLNVGHFRLAAMYNYAGKNFSNFLGIQLGFEFGGGRINK